MGRRRALLIGNSVYDHSTFPALMKAETDIHALARVLSNPDIGGFETTSFINKRVGTLLQKMERFFLQSERDDFLLFYFSGHGALGQAAASKSDYLYLIGKDTPPDFFSSRTITSSFLRELMDRSRARTQVLILDCCYSGAFLTKGGFQLGAEIVPLFGRGHAVLTSSSSSQQAWVGDDTIPLSLFTHYLVEGLETGAADKGKKGYITLDEWFDYAYQGVVNETSKQTPGKSIEKQHGSIVIAKNPTRSPKQLLPPQESHPSATQPQPHLLSHLMSPIETAYKAQDWSDVLRKADHVLKHTSEDLPATFYFWHAEALHQSGKPKKAQGAFERALVLVTDQAQRLEILLPYATLLLSQHRWNEVLALTDEALRLVPQDASWLQIQQKALGQGKTLEEWWQDAEKFRKLSQYESALTAYNQTIQLNPNDATAYYQQGVCLQQLWRYQEAITAFEQAIKLKPDDAAAYYQQGVCLQQFHVGRYQDALAAFEQAIKLKPDDAAAYYQQGVCLQTLRRSEDALAAFEQAIKLKPDNAQAYYHKGDCLFGLGRLLEAFATYDQAAQLKNDAQAYYDEGHHFQLILHRDQEAIAAFDQAIQRDPNYALAYHDKGVCLQKLGRYQDALAAFEQTIQLYPDRVETNYQKGVCLQKLGRDQEAIAAFDRVIPLSNNYNYRYYYISANYQKGICLQKLGRDQEAIAAFDQVILKRDNYYAEAYHKKGVCLQKLGRKQEAQKCYERAKRHGYKPSQNEETP